MNTGGDKRPPPDPFRGGQGRGGRGRGQRNKKAGRGPLIKQSTSNPSSVGGYGTLESVSGDSRSGRSQMEGSKGQAVGNHGQSKANATQRSNAAAGRGGQKQATPRTGNGHHPTGGWRQQNKPIRSEQSKGMEGSIQPVSLTHLALSQSIKSTEQKHGLDPRQQQSGSAAGRWSQNHATGISNGQRPPVGQQQSKKNVSKQIEGMGGNAAGSQSQQRARQKQAESRRDITSSQDRNQINNSSTPQQTTPKVAKKLETRDEILARLEILIAQKLSNSACPLDLWQFITSDLMASDDSELLRLLDNPDLIDARMIEELIKYSNSLEVDSWPAIANREASTPPSNGEPNSRGSIISGAGVDATSDDFTECNYCGRSIYDSESDGEYDFTSFAANQRKHANKVSRELISTIQIVTQPML